MELRVITENDTVTHVALKGRLDVIGTNDIDLSFTAAAAKGKPMVVDISEVAYLSSMGLRMLLSVAGAL